EGLFQVTTPVFVSVVPAGSPAAICARKRPAMDCPGCNRPCTEEESAVGRETTTATPAAEPVIVAAGFTNLRRAAPALLRSSVITTGVTGVVEVLVTCTR